jgi:hypothetical protein
MPARGDNRPKPPVPNLARGRAFAVLAWRATPLAILLLAAGCASGPETDPTGPGLGPAPDGHAASAPPFLAGPVGAILAEAGPFAGHIVVQSNLGPGRVARLEGDLLGRAGQFLFMPDGDPRLGYLGYLWDATRQTGYGISEALQGYGPCSSALRFTNLTQLARNTGLPARTWAGHSCRAWENTVVSIEGTTNALRVWRSSKPAGFPIRIEGATSADGVPFSVEFTRLQPREPAPDAFRLPDGFTRYDSLDVMLSELSLRQRTLKRPKSVPRDEPSSDSPADPSRYPAIR